MMYSVLPDRRPLLLGLLMSGLMCVLLALPQSARAQVTAFKQAVAEAAIDDEEIAAFYRERGYAPLWTGAGAKDRARRKALMAAISDVSMHGLPQGRYDAEAVMRQLESARTVRDRGAVEVMLSKLFLRYARDVQTGILTPRQVDSGLVREVPYRSRKAYLETLDRTNPRKLMRALPPQTGEYARLMKEKMRLEKILGGEGWGPQVPSAKLEPGSTGKAVVALRNRLVAMGYLRRSASATFDGSLQAAVQQFQIDHGLAEDGVAGPATIAEINVQPEERLKSVLVAMERERWINQPMGKRHIKVNLTDFSARIIDNDKVTFETRAVVGANESDRRTPEFSDVMEFMVINPSWYVPRSIITKEYLPLLKRNPGAVRHLEITDRRGRPVNRGAVNFAAYTESNFPFSMRQPPSQRNALGLVKFMFPNKYNIYLHDTPAKNLFSREVRAYSHGCIRLHQPFDFAYALLARQTGDPKGLFQSKLRTGAETRVDLKEPVPVHIMYRTAVTQAKGRVNYRRDVYGRDGRIWAALSRAGVVLRAVRG